MSYKNIYKSGNKFKVTNIINKKSKIFGVYDTLDKAVFIRDLLVKHKWKISEIEKLSPVFKFKDKWIILHIENSKIIMLGDFKTQSTAFKNLDKTIKNYCRNPNNTKYGLYISKRTSSYGVIKKLNNKTYSFGYYKKLKDAVLARNLLIEYEWDLNKIKKVGHIVFDDETGQYCVIEIINRKIYSLGRFNTRFEAKNNCRRLLDEFSSGADSLSNILKNGKKYNVYKIIDKTRYSYGSFFSLEDAKAVRDILIDNNWDASKIRKEIIYSKNNYFWKLIADDTNVKICGKYESLAKAMAEKDNRVHNGLSSKSKRNKYIYKLRGKYHIAKRIDGELKSFGIFDSLEEAVEARDRLIANKWIILEKDSILNNIEEVISNLGFWARLIYNAFNMIDSRDVSFEELKDNSVFDDYRHLSLNKKLKKYLNEFKELNLLSILPDGSYRRLW